MTPKQQQGDPEAAASNAAEAAPARKRKSPVIVKGPAKTKTIRKKKVDPETAEMDAAEAAGEAAPAGKGRSLVIVESPAKAKTINKYLGKLFVVKASMGHIRDLPKGRFGIDVEQGFEPEYTTIRGKGKVIGELKRLAKSAPNVYLAPDPDREGEAIAWHLAETLDLPKGANVYRVVFNEITKKAILEAFEHPGKVDVNKVDAQQARRVLDRIMGYKLSPLLWKKVAKGLSAGRVQSVAVRLIVEREKEIRAFVKEEYWRVTVRFHEGGKDFHAELRKLGALRIDKNLDERTAKALVASMAKTRVTDAPGAETRQYELEQWTDCTPLVLVELEEKPKTRPPTPPFNTSQLQQKASTMLRFSAKKTMMVAQQLYEGVEAGAEGSVGLITYMRTDSTRVSAEALQQVRVVIEQQFGREYVPEGPNVFRAKAANAQEAHEAVRPTDAARTPKALEPYLTPDQHRLYTLIWNKFVASQMKPETSKVTTAIFVHGEARFIAQGEVITFDGHTRVFDAGAPDREEQVLPTALAQGGSYTPRNVESTQHFTQPPPRYSEATLVKELEKKGIGRPSTYATIISTIQDRGYATLESRRFSATELGEIVTDKLVAHFADVINVDFTAHMEKELDQIESGECGWRETVKEFNDVFMRDLGKAEIDMTSLKTTPILSDKLCDKCGAPMAVLFNKRGKFLGCSKYPECKNVMGVDGPRAHSEVVATDKLCEKCGKPMVIRTGSRGRFIACTGYPKCKNTASVDDSGNVIKPPPTGVMCEKCGAEMVVKSSRRGPFLACPTYPKCRNTKPLPGEVKPAPQDAGVACDKCGQPMVKKTSRWGKPFLACSAYPKCKNAKSAPKEGETVSSPVGAAADAGDEVSDSPGD